MVLNPSIPRKVYLRDLKETFRGIDYGRCIRQFALPNLRCAFHFQYFSFCFLLSIIAENTNMIPQEVIRSEYDVSKMHQLLLSIIPDVIIEAKSIDLHTRVKLKKYSCWYEYFRVEKQIVQQKLNKCGGNFDTL